MRKILTVMLAVMLVIAFAVPVFAAEEGSITITNAVEGQTYSVYQMATLDYYDNDKKMYIYTVLEEWKSFFEDYPDDFSVSADNKLIVADDSAVDAAELAKAALAYAEENELGVTSKGMLAKDETEVVIADLPLGYYLVDSSLGAFCGLTTTAPDAEINEKNDVPTIDKFVEEDSLVNDGIDGNEWVKANDADMFQTVNYKTVVTVRKGAMNYILHDNMEAGITWNGTVTVTVDGSAVEAGDATYTLVSEPTDGCNFEIVFVDSYVQGLITDEVTAKDIIVTYSAYLNENAEIATETNDNETWMNYGDSSENESETAHIITQTKTYKFDFVKTDAENKVLDGAKFKLYDAVTSGNEIALVKVSNGVYRVADSDETGVEIETSNGKATVIGLDGGTDYYIEETVAPDGYNKLTARETIQIVASNIESVVDGDTFTSGIQIINKTGSGLPETGSFGKTVFIIVGGIIVLGAGILLFAKKRMSQIEE